MRNLVPADELESRGAKQYAQLLETGARPSARWRREGHPQLQRLRAIATRLIPHAAQWNDARARTGTGKST